MGSAETISEREPDEPSRHACRPQRGRMRVALVLLVLVVASGCASIGATPQVTSTDDLVWDCGWRRLP